MTIYAIVDSNNKIITLFGCPQNPPTPTGYTVMDDTDSRYAAYLTAQQWQAYQTQARQALASTDITVSRITEGVVKGTCALTNADVVAYMNYRESLRAILTQAQPTTIPTSLPTAPFPAGT
jgi:hypothetical protein